MEEMTPINPELEMLRRNREDGYNYRERRHDAWTEIDNLYRDNIITNRLTQRQSVHVPMMKQIIRTLLKDIDDIPVLYFENLDNDKEAEVFLNEYWKWTVEQNNLELQDIIDKKQELLRGRTFDQWQIKDGMIKMTVQDVSDILVSRYTDPTDLHSSRFLIHMHIYKPLSELEANEDYDQDAIKRLKMWYATEQGLIKVADNQKLATEKAQHMADMGVLDVYDPILGETTVEITQHFVYRNKDENGEKIDEQLFLYVEADNQEILMKKPLEQIMGTTKDHFWRNHFPYESWADDIEKNDFWTDGVGDVIRTPNKVLDSWFSQLVENRTMRNFGMHYYDSTNESFSPGTFNPVPWGWYGVPGKPNDIVQKVDIPELSESLDEMDFVINMTEKATGATTTQQGEIQQRQVTLGEVQLALGEAKERVKGISKFYTPAWQRRGRMFLKLIESANDRLKAVKIYKEGRNSSKVFERTITPKDYMTKSGYKTKVWSREEKDANDTNVLQKLNYAITAIPANDKLMDIFQRKTLEFVGLTPEEINDIMEIEQTKRDAMNAQLAANQGGQDGSLMAPNPGQPMTQTQPTPQPV